jgi:hypothetical protein
MLKGRYCALCFDCECIESMSKDMLTCRRSSKSLAANFFIPEMLFLNLRMVLLLKLGT